MQGSLSIERMCQMGQVSRAGFYRCLKEQRSVEEDMEVRSAIQQGRQLETGSLHSEPSSTH